MTNKYLYISITGHIFLVLMCSVYFSFEKKINDIDSSSFLSANLVIRPHVSLNGIHKKCLTQSTHTEVKSETHSDKTSDPLIKLIHDAIAAQQVYPEAAQELNQSGTVKIGFWLDPSGQLSKIALLKSSGFTSIDQAALDAVHTVNSINVNGYLKNSEYMAVDVVFKV